VIAQAPPFQNNQEAGFYDKQIPQKFKPIPTQMTEE
jgi:hypothetical protein